MASFLHSDSSPSLRDATSRLYFLYAQTREHVFKLIHPFISTLEAIAFIMNEIHGKADELSHRSRDISQCQRQPHPMKSEFHPNALEKIPRRKIQRKVKSSPQTRPKRRRVLTNINAAKKSRHLLRSQIPIVQYFQKSLNQVHNRSTTWSYYSKLEQLNFPSFASTPWTLRYLPSVASSENVDGGRTISPLNFSIMFMLVRTETRNGFV